MTERERVARESVCGTEPIDSDIPPEGYVAWHLWAERQHKAGKRQRQCALCSKWRFPCELSERTIVTYPQTSKGVKVRRESPVCLKCDAASAAGRR